MNASGPGQGSKVPILVTCSGDSLAMPRALSTKLGFQLMDTLSISSMETIYLSSLSHNCGQKYQALIKLFDLGSPSRIDLSVSILLSPGKWEPPFT